MQSKSKIITLDTKEWVDSNVNCYFGCSNNCRYCYAKKWLFGLKEKQKILGKL